MASSARSDLSFIGVYATRIAGFAANLQQAHRLGAVAGDHHEPWTVEFQQLAVPVYLQTLPEEYLQGLATQFDSCAEAMARVGAPVAIERQWSVVSTYLRAVARAIEMQLGTGPPDPVTSVPADEASTPGLMRYDGLAQLVSSDGVAILADAAAKVRDHCALHSVADLSAEQLQWLRELAAGDPVVEVAARHGYSLRSMHRQLADLWRTLGVETHIRAWRGPPRWAGSRTEAAHLTSWHTSANEAVETDGLSASISSPSRGGEQIRPPGVTGSVPRGCPGEATSARSPAPWGPRRKGPQMACLWRSRNRTALVI